MTAGDYIPDGSYDAEPNYPTVFGLKLTPATNGVLLAIFGLLAAGYVAYTFVKPVFDTSQQLSADIAAKEQQLLATEETQQRIQEARNQLQEAKQLQADVLTLFANQESMDTLLLDLNERVQSANAGIGDPDRRATLSRFARNDTASGVVSDGSFGAAVNGRLERQVYDVQMQGSFAQTQSIIRSIERLQPLLVVRNFKSELDTSTQAIVLDNQGRLTPAGQPVTRITTSYQLGALLPVSTPAAPAAPAATDPAAAGAAPAASPAP
ncbi:pilus assembly protein PilO [Oscillatoria sp. FACHB-1407]|uniref:pilus assembly protein PilO n=1 Tax=Oscillatoria sp. FACHB-1407 TaxID=2692847 RepID=UPI0016834232|nr:pilus assembly protein PilO [Oscillatoria sp. FACHB-1407]MBD2462744.1 pilus assembly protein PilO [Oscillatoria sp. FACHB-1407]